MKKQNIIFGLLGLLAIGFLYKKFSNKKSMFKKKLIDLANAEWNLWNVPTKVKEGNKKTLARLHEYYKKGTNTDGSDTYVIGTAWSANFISYLMRMAGAGTEFKYSPLHSVYINEAIKNRKLNNSKKFKGFRPSEVEIEAGDLVCYSRQSGINYDSKGVYASHCDLVTEVTETKAIAIGGNVSDSVSKSTYKVKNKKVVSEKVFVIIKNYL
jgi:hypothetical protein